MTKPKITLRMSGAEDSITVDEGPDQVRRFDRAAMVKRERAKLRRLVVEAWTRIRARGRTVPTP